MQFVLVRLYEIHARRERRKQSRPVAIRDFQFSVGNGVEQFDVIIALDPSRKASRNDDDAARTAEICHEIDQFRLLVLGDRFADVVDLGQHGFVVDEFIIFAHAPPVPNEHAGHALPVERLFEKRTVFVVHETGRMALPAQARHADGDIQRFPRKSKRLVLYMIEFPDVERIHLDGHVGARVQTNCKDHFLPLRFSID